jgi:hypothetical protein
LVFREIFFDIHKPVDIFVNNIVFNWKIRLATPGQLRQQVAKQNINLKLNQGLGKFCVSGAGANQALHDFAMTHHILCITGKSVLSKSVKSRAKPRTPLSGAHAPADGMHSIDQCRD